MVRRVPWPRRLEAKATSTPEPLADAAGSSFIEDHREKLEEDQLFPRHRSVGLVFADITYEGGAALGCGAG